MGKPFWIYILKCNDDSYYTGHADNLGNAYLATQ